MHETHDTFAAGVADAAALPLEAGQLLASFGAGARDRWLDVISSDVPELTGRAPATLRSVLAEQR